MITEKGSIRRIMQIEIRSARPTDAERLVEISRLTWEGADYLEGVLEKWMADGGFFVAETGDGVVAGTVKMSLYPDGVCWLEGLRVHPEYRGMSIAAELTSYVLSRAKELVSAGKIRTIEFSTYYKNEASIHLGLSNGFRIAERFYVLSRGVGGDRLEPGTVPAESISIEDFQDYEMFLPSGWELSHATPEGVSWVSARGRFLKAGTCRFYTCPDPEYFSLLDFGPELLPSLIASLNVLALEKEKEHYSLIIPEARQSLLPDLLRVGFEFWEEPEEPNLLAFQLRGDRT